MISHGCHHIQSHSLILSKGECERGMNITLVTLIKVIKIGNINKFTFLIITAYWFLSNLGVCFTLKFTLKS